MEEKKNLEVFKYVGSAILGGIVALGLDLGLSSLGDSNSSVINRNETVTVQEESETIEAVQKVMPSVVAIVTTQNVRGFFGGIYQQTGGGTGFVISEDGLIATNKHVVSTENAKYTVVASDGKSYEARVVARDPLADFAIIKIDARDLKIVEFGDSDKLVLGQNVIAIGNALGEYQNTVTTGVVSGIGRVIVAGDGTGSSERLEGVIQTDAAINPGNSGGPLVNISGQVIGINTAVDQQGASIGFAIPINSIRSAVESVVRTGEIERPRLGLRYLLITDELAAVNNMEVKEGALVSKGDAANELAVEPGGPAAQAGIQEGDILISINGNKITENSGLGSILQKFKPGETVQIEIVRGNDKRTVSVRLGKL